MKLRSDSDLEDEIGVGPLRTSRAKLGSNSDLEGEITSDLEDEIGILRTKLESPRAKLESPRTKLESPRPKLESPRTKLRITSDLEEENHLGPGAKLLRTWRTKLRGRNLEDEIT